MTEPAGASASAATACPLLGLANDPGTRFEYPSPAGRCHAGARPVPVDTARQRDVCLSGSHGGCDRFLGWGGARPLTAGAGAPGATTRLRRTRRGPAAGVIAAGLVALFALAGAAGLVIGILLARL